MAASYVGVVERLRTRRKAPTGSALIFQSFEIGVPAAAVLMPWGLSRRHLRFASVRAYIAAMDLRYWQKALRAAERELDAATTRTALDAAAKKFMRAKATLKRLNVDTQPNPV